MEKVDVCKRGHVRPARNKWGGCKQCLRVTRVRWAKDNPEKTKASQRRWNNDNPAKMKASRRKYLYGVTPDIFGRQLAAQGGRCAICARIPAKGKELVIDHDHDTGAFRGLLCSPCNTAIGLLRDSSCVAQQAALYLRSHGK